MVCKFCQSSQLGEFPAEIAIHFPGLENLKEPPLLVFEKLTICLNCGFTEFEIPEPELRSLSAINRQASKST